MLIMHRQIHMSAIFLGVIIAAAFLTMFALVAWAVGAYGIALRSEELANNIFVLIGFAAVIILSAAFFLAAWLAVYFSEAQSYGACLAHACGSWAVLTFCLAFLSISSLAILEVKQKFNLVNNPYLSTDVDVLELRAITRLNLISKKEDNACVIIQLAHAQKMVAWISCASIIIGLGASWGAARLTGRRRRT